MLYTYECCGCKKEIPSTTDDPDPVIAKSGPRKFEWLYVCRDCNGTKAERAK